MDNCGHYLSAGGASGNILSEVISVLNHYIDTADPNSINPDWINCVIKTLKNDIIEQNGEQITPWQLNSILRVVLNYVPEEIREYKK